MVMAPFLAQAPLLAIALTSDNQYYINFGSSVPKTSQQLPTTCLKAQILAEKPHHVILETISHLTRVRARIHFEAVRDFILIENFMQPAGINS